MELERTLQRQHHYLGIFHMIMMYMDVMSKRFKDAGLRDILVQSSILTEVSVDLVLSGKMYNRSIREYKFIYESMIHIISERVIIEPEMKRSLQDKCKTLSTSAPRHLARQLVYHGMNAL